MKGCYVYFLDKDTERFVRSRIEVGRDREMDSQKQGGQDRL